MNTNIYLDYNATTPIKPEIISEVSAVMQNPGNASSVHANGRAARKIIEDARIRVSALLDVPAAQVIFNSGATEGNNTVLKYFRSERILVSAIEHPSVLEASHGAEKIPVTADGVVDLNALEDLLKKDKTALVSVMWANNETGAIQPVNEISALAKSYGALFHCDAVQAAGKIPVSIAGIDFLTISSHKLGGPQGVGALVLGLCGITPTLLDGGGQEKKARPGTENIAAIHGFGLAAQNAGSMNSALRDTLEKSLPAISKGIVVHSTKAPRLPNTTLFSVPGVKSETLVMALDLEGFSVSNGSACSSGSVKSSHVLAAMNVPDDLASCTLRISLGWNTSAEDIQKFTTTFEKIIKRIKK